MNSPSGSAAAEIAVREASADDAAPIAGLLSELGYPADESFVRARLADLAQSAGDKVFVAECGGEVAGFLSFHVIPLFHASEGLGRITAMAAGLRFQRCGIGRRLVEAAEQFAWANGCGRIEVTSGDHRIEAHVFYEATGYRQDIRRFIKQKPG